MLTVNLIAFHHVDVAITEIHCILTWGSSFDWHHIMHLKCMQVLDNILINTEKTVGCLAI
jgi:superfamily II DNA helicase RecQ